MSKTVRWGVLGAAKHALERVIPAIGQAENAEVTAISSRDISKAKDLAMELGIPLAFGSYESMISDAQVDAVYIPLPNHLHVEFAKKSLEAGKHVLVEKPLAINLEELMELIQLRDKTGLKVGEAFMVDSHPQWSIAKNLVQKGELGKVKLMHGSFTYNNTDANNVRNKYKEGGGGIWDIGCYPLHTARMVLGQEPDKLVCTAHIDPEFGVDTLASAIVQFSETQLLLSAGTQTAPSQMMRIYGDKKWMEFSIAFTPVINDTSEIYIYENNPENLKREVIHIDSSNQFKEMIEDFSNAIINDDEVPVTLENTLNNTRALLAMFRSVQSGMWEKP